MKFRWKGEHAVTAAGMTKIPPSVLKKGCLPQKENLQENQFFTGNSMGGGRESISKTNQRTIPASVLEEGFSDNIQRIQQKILEDIDQEHCISDAEIMETIEDNVLQMSRESYLSTRQKQELVKDIFNRLRKLDILQDLLEDPDITEIMVNGHENIFIEKSGRLEKYPKAFVSQERLEEVIQSIVSQVNRIVNESTPIVDVRLLDGSRVNVVLPPVALNGPTVTIRKFPKDPMTMERLLSLGALTEEVVDVLKLLVESRYNIFISGGTGSGKTTFLNALSGFIPSDERIITIEDSAELQIRTIPNLVRMEVKNANLEGKNEIRIRDLIKSALRMRPDRIIIGEVRDAAVIELLQAMQTGHDGSLSTGHANNPEDLMQRLATLVLTGMDIPLIAVKNQIASALDIVIQLGRLRDKSRKVLSIKEVVGIQNGEIVMNDLYRFEDEGNDEQGKVKGTLVKMGSLQKRDKLYFAGKGEQWMDIEKKYVRTG